MRKHQYFKVPQLQRYNLDHSRLGGSGDHSETGEETECSCRPGHNRSLQVSCRGLNKGQSMYQSLLVVMLPGEAKKKKDLAQLSLSYFHCSFLTDVTQGPVFSIHLTSN